MHVTTIWFYRFPEEMPLFIPAEIKSEDEARSWVRTKHSIKRLPQHSVFWTEDIETFPCVGGTEIARLRKMLQNCHVPHKISGTSELSLLVGPVEMRFDTEGSFKELHWMETGGPSDYHVEIRER